jgi:O-antigen/teichoic acid export membrane protein
MTDAAARRASGKQFGVASLFGDSIIYGGGRILQKFLALFLLPIYTQYLTPRDYGILAMVLATGLLIDVFVTLGWDVTFARFYFDDHAEKHRSRIITLTFYVSTIWPFLFLGSLALVMPWLSGVIMGGPGYTVYFELMLLNEFFVNWSDLPFTLFRLDHRPWRFLAFTLVRVFIQIPLTVALVTVVHLGVVGVLIAVCVTSFTLNLAAIPTYWRRIHLFWDGRLFKEMLAFATASLFGSVAFYVLNYSDRYFVRVFTDIVQVGLYSSAFMLAQPVYFAMNSFRLAWPQWHYSWLHDPPRHKRLVARGFTYFCLLSVSIIVVLGVFMPVWVRLLLRKPDYWSVGPATLVLAFSILFFGAYYIMAVGANVMKKNRLIPVVVTAAALLNVGLNIILIPRYGYIAAAWSTLIGFAVLTYLMHAVSQHYYRISHEFGRLVKISAATAATLVAAWLIAKVSGESVYAPIDTLALDQLYKLPALALFPATLLALRFFTPGELPALKRIALQFLHPLRLAREARQRKPLPQAGTAAAETTPAAAAERPVVTAPTPAATQPEARREPTPTGVATSADQDELAELTLDELRDAEEQEVETAERLGIRPGEELGT